MKKKMQSVGVMTTVYTSYSQIALPFGDNVFFPPTLNPRMLTNFSSLGNGLKRTQQLSTVSVYGAGSEYN